MDQKKHYQQVFNQFMTELHLAACVDPHSFYLSWHHFSWSWTTLSANFHRVKGSFKPYMNKHDSVKEAKAKANNHVMLTLILPWKSWFTTHPPLLSWNTFTHWNEAYYMLSKRKTWGKKQEKRDGEKVKGKSQNYCVTIKIKTTQNFTFCPCALNFRSLCYFGIWIRRLWSLQPINGFLV